MRILILHDIRSCHNVGSIIRSCDGLGVGEVYMTGVTPYLRQPDDQRLPHVIERVTRQISKTALGAELTVPSAPAEIMTLINQLKRRRVAIVALEQTPTSQPIESFQPPTNLALLVGNEVTGLPADIVAACNAAVEIKMRGQKESFNVAVATALALYALQK